MKEPIRIVASPGHIRTEDYLTELWTAGGFRTNRPKSHLPTVPNQPPAKSQRTHEQVAALEAKAEAKRRRKAEKRAANNG